jgi:glycosyl-4,4'-diaponeurosporenoate acyltransferase
MPIVIRVALIALCWVTIHIGSGYLTHHLPRSLFDHESFLFRSRRWERNGEIYQKLFRVRNWKDRLPEAGSFFRGGFSKRNLKSRESNHLGQFINETRRAELTHWLPLVLSFTFFLWNPAYIAVWMPVYAILTNFPFLLVQRYLRPRLKLLRNAGSASER